MFKRLCIAALVLCVGYAANLLQECISGDDKACRKLGQQCENGDVKACRELVVSTHYNLCNAGNGTICEILAYWHAKYKNYTEAREYFQEACDLGEQSSCDRAKAIKAGEYLVPNDVQDDEEFMKQFEQKIQECNNGDTRICQNLLVLLEPICNGIGESCHIVGIIYSSKNHDVQNYHKAKEYFQKACDAKLAPACFNLGNSYVLGRGVRQNEATAKEYYGKACDLGEQKGCDKYRELRERGF